MLNRICYICIFVALLVKQADGQLDSTWVVAINGQSALVNATGGVRIPNVSATDQFGSTGPGSAPDFISDDYLRLTGSSTVDGITRYVFSQPFRITQNQTFFIGDLVFTDTPPPLPASLRAAAANPVLTQLGQTTQMTTTATLADGTEIDVSGDEDWTTYRTSNLAVAGIDQDGLVTAVGGGVAMITAGNEGATAVAQITVSLGDPLTAVEGFVVLEDGTPVADADVLIVGQGLTGATDDQGRFSITGAATRVGPIIVSAEAMVMGLEFSGISGELTPMPGGLTDAGIITLTQVQRVTVSGLCNIFGAGHATPPAPGGGGAGILPVRINLPVGGLRTCTVSASGIVSCCGGGQANGPDGGTGASGTTDITSWNGISGIRHPSRTMFLVGVFVNDQEPGDPAPPRLLFTAQNTNFEELSPVLNQTFFIGDGLTGTGVGESQRFIAPAGATRLYLGFADALDFGNPVSPPGFYNDNTGSLSVGVSIMAGASGPGRDPLQAFGHAEQPPGSARPAPAGLALPDDAHRQNPALVHDLGPALDPIQIRRPSADRTASGASTATNADSRRDTDRAALGTLGGRDTQVTATNRLGQLVGWSQTPSGESHAFLFTPGVGMADLGTIGGPVSRALALNDESHVVGISALPPPGPDHAFLWTRATSILDLNTFLPPDSGWILTSATSITDGGVITGAGTLRGQPRAFSLTFTPPSSPPVLPLVGDLDADGAITPLDLVRHLDLLRAGAGDPAADLNADGVADVADFRFLLSRLGATR